MSQGSQSSGRRRRRGRVAARAEAAFFGAVVTATDLLPPRIRYGYVHPLTAWMFRRPLRILAATAVRSGASAAPPATSSLPGTLCCALLTGSMEVGGIGSVVEVLATGLPMAGVRAVVICTAEGARVARLRSRGVDVVVVANEAEAEQALRELNPDVIQSHAAPEPLEDAATASGIPVVPVLHNMEIHFSRARWRRFARLLGSSAAAIGVSESVREFHARHVGAALAERIRVVANAVPSEGAPEADERRAARAALGRTLGTDLAGDFVLVSLARYDAQKNVAGLVSSFLATVTADQVRLIVAGEPSDWAELRRADALRRSSERADRVALLGSSDARALLAAADAFILDSFFEGWPVAATEAAATGLGLVLGDFGGARELVDRDRGGSLLIPNACGPAERVSDAAVARARRRCSRQPNAHELGAAVDALVLRVRDASQAPLRSWAPGEQLAAMVEGHADVLRRAVARGPVEARVGRVEGSSW